jgi:hypothetical protein
MAIGTYAALDNESKVFDIVDMDILDDIPAPYEDIVYIRVGEPTPTPVPTIGQTWDGNNNTFI